MPKIDNRGKHLNHARGDNHHNWRGDEVSYGALHSWVYRQLGKAIKCESCGTPNAKKYEWANISKQYKRNINDWRSLCTPCHRRFDYGPKTTWDKAGNSHCLTCFQSDRLPAKVGLCLRCYHRLRSRQRRGYHGTN